MAAVKSRPVVCLPFTDRPENIPPTQKILLEKKVLLIFLFVTTVHRITFYDISTETIAERL